jgi:tetratricopeptide (TPR) repeat protein
MISNSRNRLSRVSILTVLVLASLFFAGLAPQGDARQASDEDGAQARTLLNQGVQAYRAAHIDEAIEDFKRAKDLDPQLTNAQLYLATAYASQYIPGAPSEENIRYGELAVQEFKEILDRDPGNLAAIDGIGSILYNIGDTPFDRQKLEESKSYRQKHIAIAPDDPEPYYWVGVIDWTLVYRASKDLREEYNRDAQNTIREDQALPPTLGERLAQDYQATGDEGISQLKRAIELRPDYDDAMAYLNLLYRQKADMEPSEAAREDDLQAADDLVDKVKAIKSKNAETSPSQR